MELYESRPRRPRFRIAEVAGFIAALAIAFRWPILLPLTIVIALYLLFDRMGLSMVWFLILMSAGGFVLGFAMGMWPAH